MYKAVTGSPVAIFNYGMAWPVNVDHVSFGGGGYTLYRLTNQIFRSPIEAHP
jgi:hypothetical protein